MATRASILTRDEYLLRLREHVDALKARLARLLSTQQTRDKVLRYFMERAVQIGEACFRIYDLATPINVLCRVLCEDFIFMYAASKSEAAAIAHTNAAVSEHVKLLKRLATNERTKLKRRSTGEDVTKEFLPKIENRIVNRQIVEKIAVEVGLSKLYDIVYCAESLEVHGKSLGAARAARAEVKGQTSQLDDVAVAVSTVNALLKVVTLVADNKDRIVSADEILSTLKLHNVGGR
jgi:hypothetical protein